MVCTLNEIMVLYQKCGKPFKRTLYLIKLYYDIHSNPLNSTVWVKYVYSENPDSHFSFLSLYLMET